MHQKNFLFTHTNRNYQSARIVLQHLQPFISKLSSFLDLGGGVGSWSKALLDIGFKDICLVDHPSMKREDLLYQDSDSFKGVDLESLLPEPKQYDCILCIEVLEHFHENRALEILDFICKNTNLVLFSAAIPGQNGVGHINCQRHSYWHQQFKSKGFDFYDGFKSELLKNDQIQYWIRQNLFFYYRPEKVTNFEDLPNITSPAFELVHTSILNRKTGIREYLKRLPQILFSK